MLNGIEPTVSTYEIGLLMQRCTVNFNKSNQSVNIIYLVWLPLVVLWTETFSDLSLIIFASASQFYA